MPGTVDKLNVEIAANMPMLNTSMAAAERRVDMAANKMGKSIENVTGKSGFLASGLGGGGIRGLSALVLMHSLATAIQNYTPGSLSGNTPNVTAFDKGSAAVLDFTDALLKAIPVMGQFYEIGKSWYDSIMGDARSEHRADMALYLQGLDASIHNKSADPAVRAQGQYEASELAAIDALHKRWADLDKMRGDLSLHEVGVIQDVFKQEFDASLAEAARKRDEALKKITGPQSKGGVDSYGTMLGTYKAPWQQAIEDNAKQGNPAEEKTAVNTKKTADGIQTLIRDKVTMVVIA